MFLFICICLSVCLLVFFCFGGVYYLSCVTCNRKKNIIPLSIFMFYNVEFLYFSAILAPPCIVSFLDRVSDNSEKEMYVAIVLIVSHLFGALPVAILGKFARKGNGSNALIVVEFPFWKWSWFRCIFLERVIFFIVGYTYGNTF